MQNQKEKPTNKNKLLIIGIVCIAVAAVCAFLIGTKVAAPKQPDEQPAQVQQEPEIPEFIAEEYDQTGTCGLQLQWGFKEEPGELTIIGTGRMDDYGVSYDKQAQRAFSSAPWGALDIRTVKVYGAENIGGKAFYENQNLSCVEMGSSVKTVGESAFYGCIALAQLTLSDNMTTIEREAFSRCSALTELTLPDTVTDIDMHGFFFCTSLNTIDLSSNLQTIGDAAFCQCDSLTEITIPASVETIESGAFYLSDKLQNIYVEKGNTNYCDIDGVLFSKDKTMLIQYPTGKTTPKYAIADGVTSIDSSAFAGCEALSELTIPNGISEIQAYLFQGCANLHSITLPATVTYIEYDAFYDCNLLEHVYYGGSQADWNLIYIDNPNKELEQATIHYNQ